MVCNNNNMKPYYGTGTVSTSEYELTVPSELMCIKCGKRWETAIPLKERLKDIKCGLCGLTGFVINTGQRL